MESAHYPFISSLSPSPDHQALFPCFLADVTLGIRNRQGTDVVRATTATGLGEFTKGRGDDAISSASLPVLSL